MSNTAQLLQPSPPHPRTILLTGYEPFNGATLNPSWEAIQHRNGQRWRGYNLVARCLPVVWGAPLPILRQCMSEFQPVAVFSFGQGKPDGFYLESIARKLRGNKPDNHGQSPIDRQIADGPDIYATGKLTATMERALAVRGYPMVPSQDAGQYLCEECLYSLLHLQATAFHKTYVQFCHVPAFGNCIGSAKLEITAEVLSQFVADLLDTWYTVTGASHPQ